MTKNKKIIKVDSSKILDKEIATVKNPFQVILIILSHPKLLIGFTITIIIILSFASIKIIYENGKVKWEKKELKIDKTLNKINKVKNMIEEK